VCDDGWDIYRELEEHLYAEALGYYARRQLGRLRELEERAEKLGVDEPLLERIAQLRYDLERRLVESISNALSARRMHA